MAKPKSSENKSEDVETSARVKKLHTELGKLTFEIAELRGELNEKAVRSNEIGGLLKELNG